MIFAMITIIIIIIFITMITANIIHLTKNIPICIYIR